MNPLVEPFFDPQTSTVSYVVYDHVGGHAAIIDPVLDFDVAAARTSTKSADAMLAFVREQHLAVAWILETHAHADHLTAAAYLKGQLSAPIAIGQGIMQVQSRFKELFGLGADFVPDGRQFDRLLADGDVMQIGELELRVIATPGHTDDSLTYVIGDAAFIGDTMFAPDLGTGRTDFPGGDAATLFRSIRDILSLPPDTRLYLCHDYPPAGRDVVTQVSVAEQLSDNVHVGGDVTEDAFVMMREKRDATLPVPKLLLPALQVNIRAGELPPADDNGIAYLRLPLNQLGDA